MESAPHKKAFKGQAALEFVMTYGWAILTMTIVVVVVWQLGLFKLGGTVEPGSGGFWGLTPQDYMLTESGQLTISFSNYIGSNVTLDEVYVNQGGTEITLTVYETAEPGNPKVVTIPGLKTGNGGNRFDILMSVSYTDPRTGNQHKSSGQIWGSYES